VKGFCVYRALCIASLSTGWADMKVHSCNPSPWEAEAGGSQDRGLPGLHSETLSQKKIVFKMKSPKKVNADSQGDSHN
jgi:hypothetical protein